jgi:hypothetical protein
VISRTGTAALLLAATAFATGAAASDQTPVVMVSPTHQRDLAQRTAEAVAAQLADLPVAFTVEWTAELAPDMRSQVDVARKTADRLDATAVFWVDLSVPEQLFLYIAEREGGRILVRNISADDEDLEARLETVALIIRGAVTAFLAGGKIGVEAPPPEPEEPTWPTGALDVFVAYALTLYSSEELLLHGARLGLSVRLGSWVRAHLAYRLQIPLQVEGEYVGLDVHPHPFELGVTGRFPIGDWYVDTGVGLLVDVVTVDVIALEDEVLVRRVDRRWLFGATPSVGVGRRLGRILAIYLAVGADVLFNEQWYAVETPEGNQTVLKPFTVRPIFRLGTLFTLL